MRYSNPIFNVNIDPPKVLAPLQTTDLTDHYFRRVDVSVVPEPVLLLLRDLQTQVTALQERIIVLEAAQ